MADFKEWAFTGSRSITRLPRSTHGNEGATLGDSVVRFEQVEIDFANHGQLMSGVASRSLERYTQLAWALLMREYCGTGDEVQVVFGTVRHHQDKLDLEQQSLSLAHPAKVHDLLTELESSTAGRCEVSQCPLPVQTAVHVCQKPGPSILRQNNSILASLEQDQLTNLKSIIVVEHVSDALTGCLLYDPRHLKHFYAISLSQAFPVALRHVVSNNAEAIADISCLAPEHEEQIRVWTPSHIESWSSKLDQMFTQTACCNPRGVAVESYEGTFTFEQLDQLSDSVMLMLQREGANVGDFIGHCFDLGICAIVATLAIFKAGCVLVPLEPTHPLQRHSIMLHEVRAQILLSDRYGQDREPALGVSVVPIDLHSVGRLSTQSRPVISYPEAIGDDAVICFTSGSTGTPKGIVQTHTGLSTIVRALSKRFQINPNARMSGLHPYIFDVSIMEIFCAFWTGAVLCIPRKEDLMVPEPDHLGKALAAYTVTHTVLSPTMLKTLSPAQIPSMHVLMSMGESLDHDTRDRGGGRKQPKLFQLWGTTEASILQTCTEPIQLGHNPRNIGRSLPRTCRIWIVDCRNHRRLLPIGAIGEILVEGPILANGYFGNDAKTKESFISSPNWLTHEKHFGSYRTGDLARYDSDGSIVFVGRQDNQINFHGERIELGEIDYRLLQLQLPGVVDIFSDFDWDRQTIIAFCCLESTQRQSGSPKITLQNVRTLRDTLHGTRERLRQHLQSYLVPQFYLPISKRPVTVTGKTDRRLLRDLVAGMTEGDLQVFADLDLEFHS